MKKTHSFLLFLALLPLLFSCQGDPATAFQDPASGDSAIRESVSVQEAGIQAMLTETRTTQYFTDEPVPLDDMKTILEAGRNAYSGRNMQPWHFGAILNQQIIGDLASTMTMGPPPGTPPAGEPQGGDRPPMPAPSAHPKAGFADAPAAIALATDPANAFSTGLACQNMVIAATALGYGTKIVMGGAAHLNKPENRNLLHIPDGMDVIAILIVGKADTGIDPMADGVTGASVRKSLEEVATILP
ncbi:MAG: nitroreductase family protein [Bacteroidales bacterium]